MEQKNENKGMSKTELSAICICGVIFLIALIYAAIKILFI